MAYNPQNPNGQATSANSAPVVIASDQSAIQATLQTQTDTVMVGGVNVKEINAVTPLMGNGVTGTGSQRVTIASDNTVLPGVGAGATGSAPPANASYLGVNDGTNLRGATANSTTYTAKYAQDANLLGTLGTAFSTAGKVDVKAADGDVFVRSNAASTFPTQATLQTQTDTVMVGGVNVKEINAVTPLMGAGNGGTGSLRVNIASDQVVIPVGGTVATNVAITANPLNLGAQAVSSENTAVTTARQVQLVADLVGKQIVLPYANPENFVNGTTAAIVDTTSTSTIAAQGVGVRTYITQITVTNSHATVGTFVKILDGATIIHEAYAAAGGGGYTASFPTPLRGTANTAVNTQCVTTGANVIASVSGYKGV